MPRLVRSRMGLGEDIPLPRDGDPGQGPPDSGRSESGLFLCFTITDTTGTLRPSLGKDLVLLRNQF